MAFHGKNSRIYVAAVERTAWLNSLDVGVDLDTADTTVFASTWKTAIPGTLAGTMSLAGFYDPAVSQFADLATAATEGTVITVCPGGGTAIGDPARMGVVTQSSYGESSPVGGVVAFTSAFTMVGAVGLGYLLHPMSEDTNDTIGATRNDGAATSTGWTATLHVTAVDGGSWATYLQDSANGTDWAGVADASFSAVTGAASQRLVSASATTTLRRYVRYYNVRSGGSAGDGITFAIALARNA
jgi:hypothetical protein